MTRLLWGWREGRYDIYWICGSGERSSWVAQERMVQNCTVHYGTIPRNSHLLATVSKIPWLIRVARTYAYQGVAGTQYEGVAIDKPGQEWDEGE